MTLPNTRLGSEESTQTLKEAAIMATALETPLQAKTIAPSLTVDDLQKSIAFFEGLGFGVEERWEENDVLNGVMLRAGEARIGLSQDDWKKGRDRQKGEGFRIFCLTKGNVDRLAERIQANGGRLDHGPTDQPWGVRDISLTDPDGFKITIAAAKRGSQKSA
jgi:catechol 2,3-dioxygenase-like lactoylglutathione lyase family enzyme